MLGNEIDILILLESIRQPWMNDLFESVTFLGEHTVLVAILAVVYFMFDKQLAKRVMFVTMASLSINGVVKNIVKLPRPFSTGKVSCVRPETATGYSFPSGHTQNVATWSTAFAHKLGKLWIALLSVIITLAVAFSRAYLGAHYISDVITGAVLGFALAVVFGILYDKVKDKNVLYAASVLAMTPFVLFFLIEADLHFADFYKFYGMLTGLFCASAFEEKYVDLGFDAPMWKKLVRVIFGILLALALKETFEYIFSFSSARLSLISESVRYFILIFVVMGLYPLVLKKIKL